MDKKNTKNAFGIEKPTDISSENNETAPTMNLNKIPVKSIRWSPENELIMVEWCDIAQCYKWLHSKCHTKLANRQAWFTIPAIALSTISGTASFAQASLPQDIQVYAPMAIGTINILIGISTTIQQYLKIAEMNESHRISAISWDKFARNILIELAKDPDERMEAGQFLKICRAEFDRLMETSPRIDDNIVQEFFSSFEGEETKQLKREQEIIKQKRFYELRKPDICNIIVSANESRHHWYKDPERVRQMLQRDESANDIEAPREIDIYNHNHRMELEEIKMAEEKEKKEEEREIQKQLEIEIKNNRAQQFGVLNDYVQAFVESVGRKPYDDEIELNMKTNVDSDTLQLFLENYRLDKFMSL